ncbi:peptidoglycan editing factor PgeF [Phycicoccus ginsengisoli]
MFYWREESSRVRWAVTDRQGGASTGEFDSLNLGGHVGDDPLTVEENRTRVATSLGLHRDRLLFLNQCHGADVLVADGPWPPGGPPAADGVVTAEAGLGLAVLVADCTPVLLADPDAGVVGAVHAGRPGMTSGVVGVALERMRELGARDVAAVVGPSVCGRCYEVPEQMRATAAAVAPESATVSWTGTPAIDVAAGVVAQLHAAGVAVKWLPGCAREDHDLYSYRRDGRTGRFAGVVVLDAA